MIRGLDEYKQKWNIQSANSIQLGLKRMKEALTLLGNPHKNLEFIHVTGTNGKGSAIAFLEQFFMQHHLTVGKFTSPCIVDLHDQIQINGNPIPPDEMDNVFNRLKQSGVSGLLTDFELLTCAAFLYFSIKKADIVLLEVGMGGRDDSTNVITPIVSIITNIDIEHTNFLGNTLESIAQHKAGIIKKGRPVVIGKLADEARQVVIKEAKEKGAAVYEFGRDFTVRILKDGDEYIHKTDNIHFTDIKRDLIGDFQSHNMALAITAFLEAAKHFQIPVSEEKIVEGAKKAYIPSRFEQVLPNVFFDGAHNPAGAKQLVNTIQKFFPKEKIRILVGMLKDKDVKQVLNELEKVCDEFYFIDFQNERAMDAKNLFFISNASKKEIIHDSVSFLKKCSNIEGITVVTGSLYLLAEIRNELLKEKS